MREQVEDDLLTIGEFAEISGVPTKTLRYYDRIELFKPITVDPSTSYRYYSTDQLPEITRILTLKDLGLSLEQIAQLLEDDLPLPELRGMLRLKKIEIQRHLEQEDVRPRTYRSRHPVTRRGLQVRGEGRLQPSGSLLRGDLPASIRQRHPDAG